jgi:protein SCO1/2
LTVFGSHRAALPFYRTAALTPEWIAASAPEYSSIHRVADFALLDQRGVPVTEDSVAGRVYVASFFYSDCRQLCPRLKSSLSRVQNAFRDSPDVLILSHTVFPEVDDTARLDAYAAANGVVASKWHLLTGRRDIIERLARESYFVELSDTTGNTQGRLLHTETLVLVDQERRIRGVYDGSVPFDVDRLIEDIRVLQARR